MGKVGIANVGLNVEHVYEERKQGSVYATLATFLPLFCLCRRRRQDDADAALALELLAGLPVIRLPLRPIYARSWQGALGCRRR